MKLNSCTKASIATALVLLPFATTQIALAQSSDPATVLRQYASSQYHPLGDYVPCMFDESQKLEMRTQPGQSQKALLDSAGATAFVNLARENMLAEYGTVDSTTKAMTLTTPTQAKSFYDNLPTTAGNYEGLTIYGAIDAFTAATKIAGLSSVDIPKIVSNIKSQVGVGGIERPDDVSCSFSILPWRETNEVFGRMVANDYVAIEVNIRNLNKQNEFLVHDIQVAVDTGLNADSFGRFEAARDKLIVRGVAQRGESDDVRNRVMNILSTVGALAGGASGALTQTVQALSSADASWLSTSVAIFQGPLLSGANKIWPDHTITNVNNVSDLAFSASSTTKTVVPVQGAVPLVTFLAQKPLGQLPFVRCGKDTKNVVQPSGPCSLFVENAAAGAAFGKPLDFKSWSPAALNILKHRTFVVVAGVHIQEVSPNAQANDISCPILTDLTIDLSAQDTSGDVSCTISGTNLGTVKSAKLEKLEQGTTISASATVTPAADGNSATLSFKASDFAGKSGTFEVFSVDSSSKETNLNLSLKFAVRPPVVENASYNPATVSASADLVVTLQGSNLDRISNVYLIDKLGTLSAAAGSKDPATVRSSDNSVKYTFKKGTLTNLHNPPAVGGATPPGGANVQYDSLDDSAKPTTKLNAKTDSRVALP